MNNLEINLKNNYKYNIIPKNISKKNKNFIIRFLFIFLIISILLNLNIYIKNKNINTLSHKKFTTFKQSSKNGENILKFNSYNIFMDNLSDFNISNNLILIPSENCPNNIETFFFKPKYPVIPYKYIKFQEKNISLKLKNDETLPSVFIDDMNEIRTKFLNISGFFLDTKMRFHNLYISPFNINHTIKKQLNTYIVDKFQKINRFFNYKEYVSKSLLYINYKKFEDKYPLDYNYMLETYSFPEEKDKIEKKFKNYLLKTKGDMWMIKPKLGSVGMHISILNKFSSINLKNYIITKYLHNPHLIRGYKYDLRFHGLISSIKPLKLYLYNEGLVRLSTEKYNFSLSNNQRNKYIFLTNMFVNKKNKNKYIYPQNQPNMEDSNLWNLETYQKYCERNNINYEKIYSQIGDIFIKAILSVRLKLIKDIEKNRLDFSNFYHLIGFDIILDENYKPYLLEMNRRCGFRDDNDAEKYYTYNIIADTLNIIGIRPINFNAFNKYKNKEELLQENLNESLCELERPRGGYKLIFPLKDNIEKYKKFYENIIPEEDRELWKKLG